MDKDLKFPITIFAFLFGSLFLFIRYFESKGIPLNIEPNNTIFFLTFTFSFMAGLICMTALEKWEKKR